MVDRCGFSGADTDTDIWRANIGNTDIAFFFFFGLIVFWGFFLQTI